VLFVGLSWFIALIYPDITSVISIMGGLCATTIDFLIPTYCYVKLSDTKWTSCKNLSSILFFGLMVSIGYISVLVTIYQTINHLDIMPRWKSI